MEIIKSLGKLFKEAKTKILSAGKPSEEEVDYSKVSQREVPKESAEKFTVQSAIETIGNTLKNTLSIAEHEEGVEFSRGTPTPPPKMAAKKETVEKKSVSKKSAVKKSETKTPATKKAAPKKTAEKKTAADKKTAAVKTATTVKTETGKKKATPKKTASKATATKTETAKKPVSKKPAAKKSEVKTPATKKAAPKKTTEKKTAAGKKTTPAKKTAASVKTETGKKKATPEKTTPKKTTPKKTTPKKTTPKKAIPKKASTKTSPAKTETKKSTEKKSSKKAEKIALYAKDIKKHYGEVDSDFLEIIVKNLGPSIYKKDAELVSCSDPKELNTVRKNFLMKKLGIDASQKVLDAAIQDVCEELKATSTKYRATFYYSLARKFKKESVLS